MTQRADLNQVDEEVREVRGRRFPSYPAYKPSGVQWLGDIPHHWRKKPLKFVARLNAEILPEDTDPDYEIAYVDISNVDYVEGILGAESYRFEDAPSRARRRVRDGDVILSTVRTYLKAIARIEKPPENLIASTGFAVVRPGPEISPGYLYRLLQSEEFIARVVASSVGVSYPAIAPSTVGRFDAWLPPLEEQQAIAAFLDRETAQLDALIARKRRLIELLKEKRTALISHAVTKGLNPKAPMKPSGIDWLGDVPAHWNLRRLKFVVSEPLKYGANEAAELDDPTLPRYIRITDVDEDGRLRSETFKSIPEEVAKPYLLKDGDLLLARSGATVGKSFYYEPSWGRAAYAGYLIRARFDRTNMMARFIHYFANSDNYWQWLSSSFIQATIQNVSAEKYANLVIPVPAFDEQKHIVRHLDSACNELNGLLEKIGTAIERLSEYRSALISAAVTGKIDVRKEVG